MWNLYLDLGAPYLRFLKRNREAHARIEQHIVVGKIAHVPAEPRDVEPKLGKQALRKPGFVEIARRWSHGQAQRDVIQRLDRWGAGRQQVLDCGCLERAIGRGADNEITSRPIPGEREARTQGAFLHEQPVVIPAETRADRPVAEPQAILDKQRLLPVKAAIRE